MKYRGFLLFVLPVMVFLEIPPAFGQGPPPDPARRADLLRKFDRDGDGRLSAEEIEAARTSGRKRREDMAKRGKGMETGELRNDERMQGLLDRFDGDGDGKLNYEEMDALRMAKRQRMSSPGGRPMPGGPPPFFEREQKEER